MADHRGGGRGGVIVDRIALALARRRRRRTRRRTHAKLALQAQHAFFATLLEVGPEDVLIDCGANVGAYARHMARSGARTHCFEPDPLAFATLAAHLGDAANVTLHAAAVGARAGEATLRRRSDFANDPLRLTQGSSLVAALEGEAMTVEVVDLAAFIAALPRPPAILKLDVEGAEVEILEALDASGVLGEIGAVFVETHDWLYPELADRTLALVERVARRPYANVNLNWV